MMKVLTLIKNNLALTQEPYTPQTIKLINDLFTVLQDHEKILLELKQNSPEKIVKEDMNDFITNKEFCKRNPFVAYTTINNIRRFYPDCSEFIKKLGEITYVNEKKFIDYIMSPLGRKRHAVLHERRVRLLKFIEKGNKS